MEYLLKKINMIDILGMMIPGAVLMLAFEKDLAIMSTLASCMGPGITGENILWIVMFVSLSYVVGMLLHEMGSILQKLMWKSRLFDPRVYASIQTGLIYNYPHEEAIKQGKADEASSKKAEKQGETDNRNGFEKFVDRTGDFIKTILAVAIFFFVLYFAFGFQTLKKGAVCFGAMILICTILQRKYLWDAWNKVYKSALGNKFGKKQGQDNNKLSELIRDEVEIKHYSKGDEENMRKRSLFDGYQSLARSFLITLVVLQVYVYFTPDKTASFLVRMYEGICARKGFLFVRYFFVIGTILRFWRYSCNKFTYIYNGYRRYWDEKEKNKTTAKTSETEEYQKDSILSLDLCIRSGRR